MQGSGGALPAGALPGGTSIFIPVGNENANESLASHQFGDMEDKL